MENFFSALPESAGYKFRIQEGLLSLLFIATEESNLHVPPEASLINILPKQNHVLISDYIYHDICVIKV